MGQSRAPFLLKHHLEIVPVLEVKHPYIAARTNAHGETTLALGCGLFANAGYISGIITYLIVVVLSRP